VLSFLSGAREASGSETGAIFITLLGGADPRAAERWRGLRISEFKRRQTDRNSQRDSNRAHAERTAPVANANVTASPTHLSSKNRT
jgi:hypothetical protein